MLRFGLTTLALAGSILSSPVELNPRQQPFVTEPITDFAEPWSLAFLPDDRILVTEKAGTLRLVDPTTKAKGTITGTPQVTYAGQGGLGDVAIHPNFAENQLVYISYAAGSGATGAEIVRGKLVLDTNGGGALEDLEIIWRQTPKVSGSSGHFSHRLLFGSDGALWVSSGDRQQFFPAQDMTTNLGKVLKLNDNGTAFAGNPFAEQGEVQSQVWSLGHRNLLGIDWDAEGRLWEVEMGPQGGDEINLVERGANYGWPLVSEGKHYNNTLIPAHSTRPEFNPPKVAWVPVISPADLVIYKADLFSEWKGDAIIASLGATGLVRVEITGDTAREAARYNLGRRTRSIQVGPEGAIYVLEDGAGGRLLKLTPN